MLRLQAMVRKAAWLAALFCSFAASAQDSAPPMRNPLSSEKAMGQSLPSASPLAPVSRNITLAVPSRAEKAQWQAKRDRSTVNRRVAVGFARAVAERDQHIDLGSLSWSTIAGVRVARLDVTSPEARALRVQTRFEGVPTMLSVRFASATGDESFGNFLASDLAVEGRDWSPVLDGETASIELLLPESVTPSGAMLVLGVSHLEVGVSQLKADPSIGQAGSCEYDVACVSDAELRKQIDTVKDAVARIVLTDGGSSYLCTGTLLNDIGSTSTPHFYTASHCIDNPEDGDASNPGRAAAVAQTFVTYWFFQAASCGNLAQPSGAVTLAGGATLLARSADYDWAMVRLNAGPPAGAMFGAWNASSDPPNGTQVLALHHPRGDLKKVSVGDVIGTYYNDAGAAYTTTRWKVGVTEPGSSGSGLFTWNAKGYFQLQGGLQGGRSSCSYPSGEDYYSKLVLGFPSLIPYLYPSRPNPANTFAVREHYHRSSASHHLSPTAAAVADYDAKTGWVRTGLGFLAYTNAATAPVGTVPVCELMSGDRAFYSASSSECQTMVNAGAGWSQTNPAAFYAYPGPSCPAETSTVYRLKSLSDGKRYRYLNDISTRNPLLMSGWDIDGIAFCAPLTSPNTGGTAVANYSGMWWNPSESGWGISLSHQGDVTFLAWYTYDSASKPRWLVMSGFQEGSSPTFVGDLYTTSGPVFNAQPFDPSAVINYKVGTGRVTFSDAKHATFAYTVIGVSQTKSIELFEFGAVPTCTYNPASLTAATNYQDMWWNPNESGWGIGLVHQGDTIFASWFTYAADSKPTWWTAVANKVAAQSYAGTFYQSSGPVLTSVPFDPSQVVHTPVGNINLSFSNGNAGSFAYNINGVMGSKAISRMVFRGGGTTCQ
jgi:hypothetical protein